MKKLILNSQSISFAAFTAAGRLMLVALCMLATQMVSAQVDCNTTMACNDGLQVSVDENCEVIITPDMILEDPEYSDDQYTVVLMTLTGLELPSALVTAIYVGQTLAVNVQLNGCAAACWGNITIEDKLPPQLFNCEDVVVDCDDDLSPGGGAVPAVTAIDACGPVVELDYFDTETTNACANDFVKTVTRTWVATDVYGNEARCTQTISVRKASIVDVVFPPNYDDIEEPAFSCALTIETLPNGAPTPEVTGFPSGVGCPNIQVYYTDVVFDICGASKKVLRQWVVVDWCTGEEASDNQIIKIIDDQPPVCVAPQDFIDEIGTDEGLCTGTYEVPAPNIIFECSDYDYVVGYKLRDVNGDPFENPIYNNVTRNAATGLYTISGLPQDTSWIVYTITDACGNSSMCFTEVYVEDFEAPTPVCEGFTVVGLEDAGWADIYGSSIDDGSFDNCAIDRFEVRRESTNCGFTSDLQFGEKVNFCCEDVDAGYIRVVMRAFDASGNFNDCIVNVNVQDKINPTIECPPSITIQCTQDYTDLNLTGEAIGFDNCSVVITSTDQLSLDDCGKGIVRRTWIATDPQGRSASCVQTINVVDSNPFQASNISWPSDLEVNGCDPSEASPEDLNSRPILFNTDCTNIAISYDDDVFYNTPDYCIKILRHWRIVDWCNYDPQNPTYFEYTQKIGFYNTVAPTFAACVDQEFTSTNGDCQEVVTLSVSATDDCTPSANLKYTYAIDIDGNGSIEYNGLTNTVTRTLPAGEHTIRWTVTDACSNQSVCMQDIIIKDTKAPTPICLGEVVWVLGEDGTAEVWAEDFNLKSEAACGDDSDLIFSFNAAGTAQAITFDCGDIPNGIAAEIALQMYVIDESGNSEFCDVVLVLQDSQVSNACADDPGKATIAGQIMDSKNTGMLNIEVELMDMDAQAANMDMTETTGDYTFSEVNYYGIYVVAPYKNDDASNGVSTLDLVMIQRHILGLTELDSPYKLIAADVNGNEKLSASDLLMIRKVILGIDTEFGDNTSWRFIPTDFEIEDPTDPFGFPEKVELQELYVSNNAINFTAIKTGDVNGSATANLNGENNTSTRSAAKLVAIADQTYVAGQTVNVPVLAHEISSLLGMQMQLEYDVTSLAFSGIKGGAMDITSDMIHAADGKISLSWNTIIESTVYADNQLFTLSFVATNDGSIGSALSINDRGMRSEYYDESLTAHDVALEVIATDIETKETALYQNSPNPFKEMTTIGFDLADAGLATIAIYDVSGVELYRMSSEFEKGYNQMMIDVTTLNTSSGVLYYTLSAGEYIATKKMLIIK